MKGWFVSNRIWGMISYNQELTDRNGIFDTPRYNNICYLPLGFDKSLEVWLHKGKPLLDAALSISSSFCNIS
jgi:hypothetical protein